MKAAVDLVSVIITTYKGSTQLARAIDSCRNQTYGNVEIIVIDDNPPDTKDRKLTEIVMEKYAHVQNITYIKNPRNLNGAAARNIGLRAAKGKYIGFLDDDDFYLPARIEKSVCFLETNPEYRGVIVGVKIQDEKRAADLIKIPKTDLSVEYMILDEWGIGTGSNIFIQSSLANEIHGFDESFLRRQDIEFMIRACEVGKIGHCEEILVVKDSNGTSNIPKYEKMKAVLNHFKDKFKKEISELSIDKQKLFYSIEATELFRAAVSGRNYQEIKESRANLERYRKLSLKEKTDCVLCKFKLRDSAIVKFLIKLKYFIENKVKKGNLYK